MCRAAPPTGRSTATATTTTQGTVSIVITKADATISVTGYTGVYDGNAHGATGSATGVKGEDLSSLLHLGATFTNVPGGTANWTFDGNGNYNSTERHGRHRHHARRTRRSASRGYTGVYDGNAHGATGSATGVKGEDLSSLLHLGATFTNVPGGTANWTFDGNGNYNPTSGTVGIVITQGECDDQRHGLHRRLRRQRARRDGHCDGVKSEDLSSLLHLGATFTNVPGGTANWTFDGNGNYNSTKAPPTSSSARRRRRSASRATPVFTTATRTGRRALRRASRART